MPTGLWIELHFLIVRGTRFRGSLWRVIWLFLVSWLSWVSSLWFLREIWLLSCSSQATMDYRRYRFPRWRLSAAAFILRILSAPKRFWRDMTWPRGYRGLAWLMSSLWFKSLTDREWKWSFDSCVNVRCSHRDINYKSVGVDLQSFCSAVYRPCGTISSGGMEIVMNTFLSPRQSPETTGTFTTPLAIRVVRP